MLNFKSFRAAGSVLASIELIRMIRKGQVAINGTDAMSFADKFFTLAGVIVQTERILTFQESSTMRTYPHFLFCGLQLFN
jgi:hypothetical protein